MKQRIRCVLAVVVLAVAALLSGCTSHRQSVLVHATQTLCPVPLSKFNGLYIAGFFTPGEDRVGNGLYLLEPYRPGAIPVVFVHGLASDPSTWVEMHRTLTSDPLIAQRYQFWAYRYETGPSYLQAAADLRDELTRVRSTLDPMCSDPAFSKAILIGHSMGGIVSKLQVTHSDNQLWGAVSDRSPEELHADPTMRQEVMRLFFFNPQPGISRVVYIGTPHFGSPIAVGRLGTIGQRLIGFPKSIVSRYNSFLRSNADMFPYLPRRPPTSIEQLKPRNPILLATTRLRFEPAVSQHTVYGWGQRTSNWWCRDGDGYVTTASARWPMAATEFPVSETHIKVHKNPSTIGEVRRILIEHAQLAHTDNVRRVEPRATAGITPSLQLR